MRSLRHLISKAEIDRESGCNVWQHTKDSRGYGLITMRAHRLAWEILRGPVGDLNVLHKCDNPSCINVSHLYLGTQLDNARDRESRGRRKPAQGERHGSSKLTEKQVRIIRKSKITNTKFLATVFCVSRAAIRDVQVGRSWKHVKD